MSYILEALQKANAQRQQGGVPGLDSGHAPAGLPHPPEVRRSWPWLAVGLTGVLLLVLLMWWWDRSQQPPKATPAATVVPAPSVMPAPSLPTAESPPAMAEVQPAPSEPTESPTPVNSRVFEASGPILAAPSVLAAPPPSPTARTPRTTSSGSAPQVSASSAGDTAGWTVSGSTYSDNPQHRMLIVNGQVVREGQELRPGLRLEVIGPRSAILNESGRRFNLNY
jgi:general secretion pathway protein B